MNSRRTRTITLNHQGRGPQDSTRFWTTWLPKPALNSLLAWTTLSGIHVLVFSRRGVYAQPRSLGRRWLNVLQPRKSCIHAVKIVYFGAQSFGRLSARRRLEPLPLRELTSVGHQIYGHRFARR